jgi:hypothetical protein
VPYRGAVRRDGPPAVRRVLAVLLTSISAAGCGTERPSTPAVIPAPSPSVTPASAGYPAGVADATALTNLPLVRSLERDSGRNTELVAIEGRTDEHGEILAGRSWYYYFLDTPRQSAYRLWTVGADGQVSYGGEVSPAQGGCLGMMGMPGRLALDSPHVVGLAIRHARAYLKGHNGDLSFVVTYTAGVGRPGAWVTFWTGPFDRLYGCRADFVIIDATDGTLMDSSFRCSTATRGAPLCP